MKKTVSFDAVVIGGGIAGLGVAVPLARAGKKVLVLERKKSAGQSTAAAAGILDPFLEMHPGHPLFKFSTLAFRKYPETVRKLEYRTGLDPGYKKMGMLYVAFNPQEEKELKRRFAWQKKSSIATKWLGAREILKREPLVRKNLRGGLFYPDIARVQPQKLLKALRKDGAAAGLRFSYISGKIKLDVTGGRVCGIRTGREKIQAPVVINASGSWAGLKQTAGRPFPVKPARGQILIVKGNLPIRSILHTTDGGYIVPWDKGTYLLGSNVEFVGYRPGVTRKGLKLILKRTVKLIPELKGLKGKTSWSGLRPFSKIRRPMIGPTNLPGFYAAAGFYRSGILIGMFAGELLAEGILKGKMPELLRPFNPKRMGIR